MSYFRKRVLVFSRLWLQTAKCDEISGFLFSLLDLSLLLVFIYSYYIYIPWSKIIFCFWNFSLLHKICFQSSCSKFLLPDNIPIRCQFLWKDKTCEYFPIFTLHPYLQNFKIYLSQRVIHLSRVKKMNFPESTISQSWKIGLPRWINNVRHIKMYFPFQYMT